MKKDWEAEVRRLLREHLRQRKLAGEKMTQYELADRLGCSQAHVNGLLRGKSPLQVNMMCEIASILGLDPASLLPESSEPKARSQQWPGHPRHQIAHRKLQQLLRPGLFDAVIDDIGNRHKVAVEMVDEILSQLAELCGTSGIGLVAQGRLLFHTGAAPVQAMRMAEGAEIEGWARREVTGRRGNWDLILYLEGVELDDSLSAQVDWTLKTLSAALPGAAA